MLLVGVKHVCTDFNFGLMLIIDKKLFSLDRDVLYVSLYVPPETSPFYSDLNLSAFQELEERNISNNLLDNELFVCGDLNARTASLPDYTIGAENIPELEEFIDMINSDIGIKRVSCDTKTNKFGYQLLEFCKVFFMLYCKWPF